MNFFELAEHLRAVANVVDSRFPRVLDVTRQRPGASRGYSDVDARCWQSVLLLAAADILDGREPSGVAPVRIAGTDFETEHDPAWVDPMNCVGRCAGSHPFGRVTYQVEDELAGILNGPMRNGPAVLIQW